MCEVGDLVLLGALERPLEGANVLAVVAVDKLDGLCTVGGGAAADADHAVELAGGERLGPFHDFIILRVRSRLVIDLG